MNLGTLVLRHEIPAQSGSGFVLKKHQLLKVIDPKGQQVSDLFCFDAHDTDDALSAGRSMDWNDTIYLTKGHTLYSNRSEALLEILEDTCGRHDFIMTPCSLRMFQIMAKNDEYHPSCHENLSRAFEPFGLSPDRIGATFNIFMNVPVAVDGRIRIDVPRSKAGDYVLFRATRDLKVGLTACSDEATNGGSCKPIHYEIYDGGTL